MIATRTPALVLTGLLWTGCSSPPSQPPPAAPASAHAPASCGASLSLQSGADVTYTNKISGILSKNCVVCHAKNGQDPELDTWPNVQAVASEVVSVVTSAAMPPSNPLSKEDQATFTAWLENNLSYDGRAATVTASGTSVEVDAGAVAPPEQAPARQPPCSH